MHGRFGGILFGVKTSFMDVLAYRMVCFIIHSILAKWLILLRIIDNHVVIRENLICLHPSIRKPMPILKGLI